MPAKRKPVTRFLVRGFNEYLNVLELRAYRHKHKALDGNHRILIDTEGECSLGTVQARSLALELLRLCNEIEK